MNKQTISSHLTRIFSDNLRYPANSQQHTFKTNLNILLHNNIVKQTLTSLWHLTGVQNKQKTQPSLAHAMAMLSCRVPDVINKTVRVGIRISEKA